MSMKGELDQLCSNYDSGAATVSYGENDEDPSHMAVSPTMIARPAIWPVKVMRFYRQCRMKTMMTNLRMKCPAQSLKMIVIKEI